jgi:hypothetical protein
MKRKSILAVFMAIAMCAVLAGSAFASEADSAQGDGGIIESSGESFASSGDELDGVDVSDGTVGTGNYIFGDDISPDAQRDSTSSTSGAWDPKIFIWANVDDQIQDDVLIYQIDIAWGAMKFEFLQTTYWNPLTLRYDRVQEDETGWVQEGHLAEDDTAIGWGAGLSTFDFNPDSYANDDKNTIEWDYTPVNNEIRIVNRSNNGVDIIFDFEHVDDNDAVVASGDNKFNKADGVKPYDVESLDVTAHFFGNDVEALAASKVLTKGAESHGSGTPSWGVGTVNTAITGFSLNSAARSNNPDDIPNAITNIVGVNAPPFPNVGYGDIIRSGLRGTLEEPISPEITAIELTLISNTAQSKSVFFAFSGMPDVDSVLIGDTFDKAGVITLTISPAGTGLTTPSHAFGAAAGGTNRAPVFPAP